MPTETGQCLCGTVRYEAELAERHHGACHCRMCRRWTGGPLFAVSVASVRFEGDKNIGRYRSSEWAERGFCKKCGTCLFYHLVQPDSYVMSVGTFDNANDFKLTSEIFIDRKPDGYSFAGDHCRLTEAETIAQFVSAEG